MIRIAIANAPTRAQRSRLRAPPIAPAPAATSSAGAATDDAPPVALDTPDETALEAADRRTGETIDDAPTAIGAAVARRGVETLAPMP